MLYGQQESRFIIEQLIEGGGAKLNDWETNFIDSLYNQVAEGRKLSIKQRETLGRIWEKCGE